MYLRPLLPAVDCAALHRSRRIHPYNRQNIFVVSGALVSVPQSAGDRKKSGVARRSGYFHAFSRRGVACANPFQIVIKFSNISNFKFWPHFSNIVWYQIRLPIFSKNNFLKICTKNSKVQKRNFRAKIKGRGGSKFFRIFSRKKINRLMVDLSFVKSRKALVQCSFLLLFSDTLMYFEYLFKSVLWNPSKYWVSRWSRRESNPCPKTYPLYFYERSLYINIPSGSPVQTRYCF